MLPSKNDLDSKNEPMRFQTSQRTQAREMHYLGTDDTMACSLTLTDVSSFSTSSPTPCTKVGQSSMDFEDEEEDNAYSSWFRSSSKIREGTKAKDQILRTRFERMESFLIAKERENCESPSFFSLLHLLLSDVSSELSSVTPPSEMCCVRDKGFGR
jgi:hypothetical protein